MDLYVLIKIHLCYYFYVELYLWFIKLVQILINIILNLIAESLSKNQRVEIRNFGTFSIRSRDQRVSRNPKTGTSVFVEAKRHPFFRASKYLKESLNE